MAGPLFNPYWNARPPECCYCPPLAPAQMPVNVTVTTVVEGGLGSLSFMTRSEDAFRVLQEQRVLKEHGLAPVKVVEVGNTPWSFDTGYVG